MERSREHTILHSFCVADYSSLKRHPEVYNYVVKPRSERAARLIVEPVM